MNLVPSGLPIEGEVQIRGLPLSGAAFAGDETRNFRRQVELLGDGVQALDPSAFALGTIEEEPLDFVSLAFGDVFEPGGGSVDAGEDRRVLVDPGVLDPLRLDPPFIYLCYIQICQI